MIQAQTTVDGEPYLAIGLSRENCTRLLDGWQLVFDGAEIGLTGTKVILYHYRAERDARRRGFGRWMPWRRCKSDG